MTLTRPARAGAARSRQLTTSDRGERALHVVAAGTMATMAMAKNYRLPEFDGSGSVKTWISKIEVIARACNWDATKTESPANDATTAVMALPAITGRAFDFAMRLPDEDRNSWKRLCEKLKAEFDAPGLTVQYALEFHQRVRAPGEALATFLYDLETLCARAYPEWEDATYRQRLVKDRFLMGIGDKSRKHILSFYQSTWSTEQVLMEARKLEQIETSAGGSAAVGAVHGNPRGDPSDGWSTGSHPGSTDASVLSALTNKIQMLEEQMQACRVSRPGRDSTRFTGRRRTPSRRRDDGCFNCGERSHWRSDCPYLRPMERRSGNDGGPRRM